MRSMQDRMRKRERVAAVRSAAGGALLLTSHESLSWYLEGVRTHVSLAGPPVLAVRVGDDGDVLYVAEGEVDRLITEDLLDMDADRIVRVPWQIPPSEAARSAGPATPESAVAGSLRAARASLLPAERDRYRQLGRDVARALTDSVRASSPEVEERDIAARVGAELLGQGIDPLVVLVAGSSRLQHRHPLPSRAKLGTRAMIVVCGRRHGLIASATRWIGEAVGDDGILAVERAFLDASVRGRRLGDAFAEGIAAYEANGFAAQEWRRHHQGGPAGYAGRDPRATPDADDVIVDWQAFAWNPTAPGLKVEDTMLRTPEGWEVLTVDPRWPAVTVGDLTRPGVLPFATP